VITGDNSASTESKLSSDLVMSTEADYAFQVAVQQPRQTNDMRTATQAREAKTCGKYGPPVRRMAFELVVWLSGGINEFR
jgi:hypothetical protein